MKPFDFIKDEAKGKERRYNGIFQVHAPLALSCWPLACDFRFLLGIIDYSIEVLYKGI